MRLSRGLLTFARAHDDLPAFHAGYIVLVILAAFLFNLGVFAGLIAVHVALDLLKERESHGFRWGRALRAAGRENLLDVAFLLVGLAAAIYLQRLAGIVAIDGLLRAETELLRLLSVTLPKVGILRRFLRRTAAFHRHFQELRVQANRNMRAFERLLLLLCAASLILLLASPWLLHADGATVLRMFAEQLAPWRI